jgi:hypothetical protein
MNLVLSKYCSLECLTIDTDSENSLVLNSDKIVMRRVNEGLHAVMLWDGAEATEHREPFFFRIGENIMCYAL